MTFYGRRGLRPRAGPQWGQLLARESGEEITDERDGSHAVEDDVVGGQDEEVSLSSSRTARRKGEMDGSKSVVSSASITRCHCDAEVRAWNARGTGRLAARMKIGALGSSRLRLALRRGCLS